MATCSLVISTYNWPAALELCLKSILSQTILPDEIIIGDDGSTAETANVVNQFKNSTSIPVIHVWQEDKGFQLARIRNKGFAVSKGDYFIQIDGDLILHRNFIRDHIQFSKPGFFSTGSRVLLSPKTSRSLVENKSIDVKKYSQNDSNFFNSLYIPFLHNFFAQRYKNTGKYKYYVKGCNMAFWKEDILKVNGYNEDFTGWGREDSEIAIRLMNAGIGKRFLKFGAISYHLFHKEEPRDMEKKNILMMEEAIIKRTTWAANGLSQYLQ